MKKILFLAFAASMIMISCRPEFNNDLQTKLYLRGLDSIHQYKEDSTNDYAVREIYRLDEERARTVASIDSVRFFKSKHK